MFNQDMQFPKILQKNKNKNNLNKHKNKNKTKTLTENAVFIFALIKQKMEELYSI